jgi:hypothetical protein
VAVVRYIIYLHSLRYSCGCIIFSLRHYCPPVPLRTPLPHCPTASLGNCPTASLCQCLMIPLACHPTMSYCHNVSPSHLLLCPAASLSLFMVPLTQYPAPTLRNCPPFSLAIKLATSSTSHCQREFNFCKRKAMHAE